MQTVTRKQIDWDSILETYGPETKIALHKLLSDHDIPESDPAALVIAALFMTQIDSNRAFNSISETINSGKKELSAEFSDHIVKLRGIITYAEEHLIETGQQEMEQRRAEMHDVIKEGIAKAIGQQHRAIRRRETVGNLALMIGVAAISAISLLVGAAGAYVVSSSEKAPDEVSAVETVSNAEVWTDIAESNQAQLLLCLENLEQLERKCAISIPE
ncbi:MAG: hypothetical protein AAF703_23045 [Cyanobacteria bacterium P01_D01_bin.105]